MPTLLNVLILLSLLTIIATATTTAQPAQSINTATTNHRNLTGVNLIKSILRLSSHHITTAQSLSNSILSAFPNHRNRSHAARTCLDVLSLSSYRTHLASRALPRNEEILNSLDGPEHASSLLDSRAWASAALTYQYDCWSELSYVNGTRVVDYAMLFINNTLMVSTSNALSMLHDLINFGSDSSSWVGPPKTERDGFWEKTILPLSKGLRFEGGGVSRSWKVDSVVCKEGKARGCHKNVQEAVNNAPAWLKGKGRFVILIKVGVYEEIVRVPLEKRNLVFLGDGVGKTVITGSVNTGVMGITTYNTATVGVKGDGFTARDITFQNTAGPNAHQAVAFRSDSDFSLIENCQFLSNQDTLYTHSLRQVYKSCHIEGNVDFIFGNAAAIFQDCTILVRPRLVDPTKGENNAITACGRIDPAQPTGLVFIGCYINGTNEYMKLWGDNPKVHRNYLGRPWKMYSRTVFIESILGPIVSPEGWLQFRPGFGLSTLYYGEFGNTGPGSDRSKRVQWSSLIPEKHLAVYSAQNFIQADEWN